MAQTYLERKVSLLLTELASCLCAEIDMRAREGEIASVCMCTVLPGDGVPFDYCEDGQAWVRLVSVGGAADDALPGNACVTQYDITVEMGILRCAPTLKDDGSLPDATEHLASSLQQSADMGLMHRVLTCCCVSEGKPERINTYAPVGPDGGCVGGIWQATWRIV